MRIISSMLDAMDTMLEGSRNQATFRLCLSLSNNCLELVLEKLSGLHGSYIQHVKMLTPPQLHLQAKRPAGVGTIALPHPLLRACLTSRNRDLVLRARLVCLPVIAVSRRVSGQTQMVGNFGDVLNYPTWNARQCRERVNCLTSRRRMLVRLD